MCLIKKGNGEEDRGAVDRERSFRQQTKCEHKKPNKIDSIVFLAFPFFQSVLLAIHPFSPFLSLVFGRRHGSSIPVDGNGMHLRRGRLSSVGFCEERIGGGTSVSVAEDEQDSVRRKKFLKKKREIEADNE